jgi:hypothetical protein
MEAIEFAGPEGSGEPFLYATPDGRVLLSWLESDGSDRHALRLAVRDRGAWSEGTTVVASDRHFVNWADFPSITVLPSDVWIVHWLEKTAPTAYAYHVKLAVSRDGGASWSDPFSPHEDTSATEHGFVSVVPTGDADAALVWLDGRQMAGGHDALDRGDMSLRATTLRSDGAVAEDVLLDARTCECCQTALVRAASGLVAAYRDRSEGEIRDIAVVRHVGGAWTEPVLVAEDGFHYPGCPVNGPQLAAVGDTVAIAWYAAPDQAARVTVAFSTDAGASFGTPIRVDGGDPLGRVDVELLDARTAVVVWVERTPDAAEIRARVVRWDGRLGEPWVVTHTSPSRGSGFPRAALVGADLLVAWTQVEKGGGVRVATARRLP